jgi:hypothetical protein
MNVFFDLNLPLYGVRNGNSVYIARLLVFLCFMRQLETMYFFKKSVKFYFQTIQSLKILNFRIEAVVHIGNKRW